MRCSTNTSTYCPSLKRSPGSFWTNGGRVQQRCVWFYPCGGVSSFHRAPQDEEQIEHELREELERRRREEEERRLAEQRERERIEREQREREAKLEQERLERERAESAKTVSRGSGVRGVRGTRASMRGMTARGMARPGVSFSFSQRALWAEPS